MLPLAVPVTAPVSGPLNAVADSVPPLFQLGPPVESLAGDTTASASVVDILIAAEPLKLAVPVTAPLTAIARAV